MYVHKFSGHKTAILDIFKPTLGHKNLVETQDSLAKIGTVGKYEHIFCVEQKDASFHSSSSEENRRLHNNNYNI